MLRTNLSLPSNSNNVRRMLRVAVADATSCKYDFSLMAELYLLMKVQSFVICAWPEISAHNSLTLTLI